VSSLAVVAAFVRRDWRIDSSYRASFALQTAATVLVLAIFFYLARAVDDPGFSARQGLEGGYFAYVAVGLALLQIIQASLSSSSRRLREDQTTGTLETLMTTPARPSLIVLASSVYDLLRATLSGVLLLLAAVLLFGLRLEASPPSAALAVVILLGCLGLFAALGVAVAAFTILFKRTTVLLALLISALALLGGVYFPVTVLPGALEALAQALPFTWGVDALRASLLGGSVNAAQLAGLFASAVVLLPLALIGFERALRRARRTGTLTEY
jgi:ABC-2 type transport system permease protein